MTSDAQSTNAARARSALVPEGWSAIDGLVCGFGDRVCRPPPGTVLLDRQVHGTRIVDAASAVARLRIDRDDGLPRIGVEADGLVATGSGKVAGVRTADCVPLLLVAPRARWAAAVHAGWRGTLAGIAGEAVRAAGDAGIAANELRAAIGPSIGPCCYEVSHELGNEFVRAGLVTREPNLEQGPGRRPEQKLERKLEMQLDRDRDTGGRPHVDLRASNRLLLERSGVPPAHIVTVGPCTRCANDRYHSFRAEPQSDGRQVSWIGWRE